MLIQILFRHMIDGVGYASQKWQLMIRAHLATSTRIISPMLRYHSDLKQSLTDKSDVFFLYQILSLTFLAHFLHSLFDTVCLSVYLLVPLPPLHFLPLLHRHVSPLQPTRTNTYKGWGRANEYHHLVSAEPIKRKSDAFDLFTHFTSLLKQQYNIQVVTMRSDNGGKFISKEFTRWLAEEGIVHNKTIPYTSSKNEKAERLNRTIVEMVCFGMGLYAYMRMYFR